MQYAPDHLTEGKWSFTGPFTLSLGKSLQMNREFSQMLIPKYDEKNTIISMNNNLLKFRRKQMKKNNQA